MSFFESQVEAWDAANWELSLVFEGLSDEDLWRRPHPRLLSVGELAVHVADAMVERANALDPSANIESPLCTGQSEYYPSTMESPFSLNLTVAQTASELARLAQEVKAAFLNVSDTRDDPAKVGPGRTMGQFADYMVFHVAYHTGQAFSVRHSMGHTTTDN